MRLWLALLFISPSYSLATVHKLSLPQMVLTGDEKPMAGKSSYQLVDLPSVPSGEIILTRFEMRLIDDQTREELPEMMCHGHIVEDDMRGYDSMRFLGVHVGGPRLQLPNGLGVRLNVSPKHPLRVYGMAGKFVGAPKRTPAHYEVELEYFTPEEAKKKKITPLDFQMAFMVLDKKTYPQIHRAHSKHMEAGNFHWMVPPGRHEYRSSLNKELKALQTGDLVLYHVHNHVHAYAESYKIYDRTLKKVIFNGTASTNLKTGLINQVTPFSSQTGVQLSKNHDYELVVTYNNPRPHAVDAMYTGRFFFTKVPHLKED